MAMNAAQKAQLLAATKEAAAALLSDIRYLRELLARTNIAADDIRRASVVLRRLLVEDDLVRVAGPRVGRVRLVIPDNGDLYDRSETELVEFFASGGPTIFGVTMRAALAFRRTTRWSPIIDPDRTVEVQHMESFMKQRVLCLDGHWVDRRAVIKFVANVASGVHSRESEPDEKIIARIRTSFHFKKDGDGITFVTSFYDGDLGTEQFVFTANSIDVVLVELMAAAHYLLLSPSIGALEPIIAAELGI